MHAALNMSTPLVSPSLVLIPAMQQKGHSFVISSHARLRACLICPICCSSQPRVIGWASIPAIHSLSFFDSNILLLGSFSSAIFRFTSSMYFFSSGVKGLNPRLSNKVTAELAIALYNASPPASSIGSLFGQTGRPDAVIVASGRETRCDSGSCERVFGARRAEERGDPPTRFFEGGRAGFGAVGQASWRSCDMHERYARRGVESKGG